MSNLFSLEEAKQSKKRFQKEYYYKKPYSEYVNGCAIVKVGIKDKNAPADQKNDYCIYVTFRSLLPSNLFLLFPTEYEGMRVVTKVIGKVRFLKD